MPLTAKLRETGNACPQTLEHVVAFGRLVLQKELIDDDLRNMPVGAAGRPLSVIFRVSLPVESYRVAAHSTPPADRVL